MRKSKKSMHQQREILEEKIKDWLPLREEKAPRSGWLKAIRGALGLSTYQLAKLQGISQATASEMEARETKGKITLENLERAASAMDCKLIYAIVPIDDHESLDAILSKRANAVAKSTLKSIEHTMQLEKQGSGVSENDIEKLSQELKDKLDSRLWEKRKS